jgi:hypothetical protein
VGHTPSRVPTGPAPSVGRAPSFPPKRKKSCARSLPIRGYLGPPGEISAVRRLIGGAMRTRTKDPRVEGQCLAGVCSFILSGGGTSVELCSNADRPPRARECCGGTPKILQVPDFAAKQGLVSTELRPTKVRSSSGVFFATFRRVAEAFPSSLTIARTFRGVR